MTLSVVPNDDAQFFFSGHIHWPHVMPGWRLKRDHAKLTMIPEKYYAVSSGSFLEFWGSYGEVAGFPYTGLLMPLAVIRRDGGYRTEI